MTVHARLLPVPRGDIAGTDGPQALPWWDGGGAVNHSSPVGKIGSSGTRIAGGVWCK